MIEIKFSGETVADVYAQMRNVLGEPTIPIGMAVAQTMTADAPKSKKAEVVPPAKKPEVAPPPPTKTEPTPTPPPSAPASDANPTLREELTQVITKAALKDKAATIALLAKFKVTRGKDLTDDQAAEFIPMARALMES